MTAPNPYAPPRDDVAAPLARGPLPEGIRRYGLDPAKLRALLDRQWRSLVVRLLLFLAIYLVIMKVVGFIDLSTTFFLVPVLVAYVVVAALFRRWRVRSQEGPVLQGYELLVAPRAIRRTALRVQPAEMLATEVTSIVEVPTGLSIEARGAGHRLFVVRALAGYEDLRAHVASWRPIETRSGIGAFLRRWSHLRGEKMWGPVADPALAQELAALRALAMPWNARRAIRPLRRMVFVAILWVLLFAALWIFLSPVPRGP
jgi:hypothetical protein